MKQSQIIPQIRAASLQSGSNGNCIYVEAAGMRLLFDAGIPGRAVRERLAQFERKPGEVDAVIISHDHGDHVRCAGVYNRMFGLPLYMTPPTHSAAAHRLGRVDGVCTFQAGETLRFGEVLVQTLPTPHDGVDGVAFVVEAAGRRLGILTDLGRVFAELEDAVASLDGVFLESNYDADMLEAGPYPWHLKDRIRGGHGHISNAESADLLARAAGRRLRWACLAHLSEENNCPHAALRAHRDTWAGEFPVHLASHRQPVGMFEL